MHPGIRSKMKKPAMLIILNLAARVACAQDPAQQGAIANQQAIQQMQQATQQSIEQSQQATQAMQAQQDLIRAQSAPGPAAYLVTTPRISVKEGQYPGPLTVRLKDSTRGAVIYYTTDGWTPTTQSTRYVGPISITSTTTLQAIAVDGGNGRSRIASARYTLPAAASSNVGSQLPAAIAGKGLPVRVVFTAPFSSKGLQVGDPVPLALAEAIHLNGTSLDKGAPVAATVTHVDGPGWSGLPASITFELHTVVSGGRTFPIVGSETKEGSEPNAGRQVLPFYRGHSVEIPSGAQLTAFIEAS